MAKPGPRTAYQYSAAVKISAVRLSQLPGVAVGDDAALVDSLGVRQH